MKPRTALIVFALAFLTETAAPIRDGVRAFERGVPDLEGSALPQRFVGGSWEDALVLARSWRGRDKRRAIQVLEARLDVLSRRNPQQGVSVRLSLGDLYRELGRVDSAIDYYQAAVSSAASPSIAVDAECGIAQTLLQRDELDEAFSHAENALVLAQSSRSEALESRALLTRGIVLYEQTRFEEALRDLSEAEGVAERVGDVRTRTEALLHTGFARADLGEDSKAIRAFQRALDSSLSVQERRLEALALVGLGHTYSKLGEKQRALELYVLAEPLIEGMEDPFHAASLDSGLGYVYTELGDYENAERYYQRAISLNDRVRSRWSRAANLVHLARLYSVTELPEKAVSAFHAAIADLRTLPDRGLEAAILGELAGVLDRLERHGEAEATYARALAASERSGSERSQAELLNDIGAYELRRGLTDTARGHFERALELSRKTSSPFAEAQALFNLARAARDEGHLDEALKRSEGALALVEALRASISSHRLRSAFVASVHELQELHVSLLMELDRRRPGSGFDRRAFLAAELAKARSLLDRLTEDHVVEEGDPALRKRARRLRDEVVEAAAAWDQRRAAVADPPGEALPDALEERLLDLERIEAVLRGPRGGFSALGASPLKDVADVQQDFLDGDSALLSYFLGREESYLWIVTKDEFRAYRLPKRDAIESSARRIHELLSARSRREEETALTHRRRVVSEERELRLVAAPLAETLLGPAIRDPEIHRFLVAADGALHLLPFSILPLPGRDGSAPRPVVARYEVVRLASASVWDAILRRGASREDRPRQLAVIADPVFDQDDPRLSPVTANKRGAGEPAETLGTARRWRQGLKASASSLPRLLSTRQEARAISSLLRPEEQLQALGFRANRALVTGGELAAYDVVHFATHGVLNAARPALSGIALSFVDRLGRPENGMLRLDDIERLRLPVGLVVLSACDTALGKEVLGEGLVGLVGGFLTAGADGVLASYWKVEDEATAELMRSFYVGLISDRLPPPTALRKAQTQMLAEGRWGSPYYFGAFEFHGSWR